jgi:hypothetical protein
VENRSSSLAGKGDVYTAGDGVGVATDVFVAQAVRRSMDNNVDRAILNGLNKGNLRALATIIDKYGCNCG